MIRVGPHKFDSVLTAQELRETEERLVAAMTDQERQLADRILSGSGQEDLFAAVCATLLERPIVRTSQWLKDPYLTGAWGRELYNVWGEDLCHLFDYAGYDQFLISGSYGAGKTTVAQIAAIRFIYELGCYKEPARILGLASGSPLTFALFSATRDVARNVLFEPISNWLESTPYFCNEFDPLGVTKEQITFPKNISIASFGTTENSFIGTNVIGAVFDEASFIRRSATDENIAWGSPTAQTAGKLYETILRRMRSRLVSNGKFPGLFILVSSKAGGDGFLEQLIAKEKEAGSRTTMVRDRAIIDVKRTKFSNRTFRVWIGRNGEYPVILDGNTKPGAPGHTIEIPEDFRRDFDLNLVSALRDICGINTKATDTYMDQVSVAKMFAPNRRHPWQCHFISNEAEWDGESRYLINWDLLTKVASDGSRVPLLNPHKSRVIHLDPAYSPNGDGFGFCMGHISGSASEESVNDHAMTDRRPVFHVDFILRIKAAKGSPLRFANVRKLIYDFTEQGFSISKITFDSFQTLELTQALGDRGYSTELVSVDRTREPYAYLKRAIEENRVNCYPYPTLERELLGLKDTGAKIDHPHRSAGVGKDLADALCGMVFTLGDLYNSQEPILPLIGDSRPPHHARIRGDDVVAELKDQSGSKKTYPKNIPPQYTRRRLDGTVEDLTNRGQVNASDYILVG